MNRRRTWLRAALGAGALSRLGAVAAADSPTSIWRERRLTGFGTTLKLKAAHTDATRAERALNAAVLGLREVERTMSLFDPSSEITRLNRDGALPAPHPWLIDVLHEAAYVAERSGGVFDITVQPLWTVWADASRADRRPDPAALAAARRVTGWRRVTADRHGVRLAPGTRITLNGIAQGFALDRARDAMRQHGVAHALLDVGEWAALGQSPEGSAWQIGIKDPRRSQQRDPREIEPIVHTIALDTRAMATSSDDTLRFTTDGSVHHILDPRSGASPSQWRSVTVLAESGARADALTKVVFMNGPDALRSLARRWSIGIVAVDRSGRIHRAGEV